jgi:alpha-glucosidase
MLKGNENINLSGWTWWKHGVIYHIYVRSFFDSDGDGIGDLNGLISKLDYLVDLGINAIWLSPVYDSPNFDFGYDVTDYRGINPEYGTVESFRNLLQQCHSMGIRVIMDMILNHTSLHHPWFVESRLSRFSEKRQWYIWKDGIKGGPPNNWKAAVGGSAWEYDLQTEQFYLHSFFREQPDLNWRNPEVAERLFDEMKFWLDLGVDGFRLDVINMIVKDKKFRNNPVFWGLPVLQKHKYTRNRPKSRKIVMKLRELLDGYPERTSIGEIYSLPPGNAELAASYLANGNNGLHLAFDFSLIFSSWKAADYHQRIADWDARIPKGGWPCNVLSNHDLFRSMDRFGWRRHKLEKARISAVLLMTLRGTPFIYYGEEIGMKNGKIGYQDILDPLGKKFWPAFSGRDKARTPMQWTSGENAGFSEGSPWLPVHSDYRITNVQNQKEDPDSLFSLYKTLMALRKLHPALMSGRWVSLLNGKTGVLAYSRIEETEHLIVVLNFTGSVKRVRLAEHIQGEVIFSTHRPVGDIYYMQDLKIDPYEASIFIKEED